MMDTADVEHLSRVLSVKPKGCPHLQVKCADSHNLQSAAGDITS